MKKKIFAGLVVVICFLLQSTLFAQFTIGGIRPNLLVIAVAFLGLWDGKRTGIYAGFFSGLLIDISFGYFYGLNALIYMYIGFFCGFLKKYIYSVDIKMPILFIMGCDLGYSLLYYFFAFALRGNFHFWFYLTHLILPQAVYTTIMACVLYPVFHIIVKQIEKGDKGEELVG